ncbi:MAG: hypothetical protein GY774_22795 [Planctomycetes bacterium]|nr:hypothetical protein [Planctomycetota bacterium]
MNETIIRIEITGVDLNIGWLALERSIHNDTAIQIALASKEASMVLTAPNGEEITLYDVEVEVDPVKRNTIYLFSLSVDEASDYGILPEKGKNTLPSNAEKALSDSGWDCVYGGRTHEELLTGFSPEDTTLIRTLLNIRNFLCTAQTKTVKLCLCFFTLLLPAISILMSLWDGTSFQQAFHQGAALAFGLATTFAALQWLILPLTEGVISQMIIRMDNDT